MKPTPWQWLILAWLLGLHAAAYVVIYFTTGSLTTLHWVLWAILAGPYAQGSLLGFLLVVGTCQAAWRRLSVVAGIVLIMTVCHLFFEREVVLLGFTTGVSVVVSAVVTLIAGRFLTSLPAPSLRKIHFALWEIIAQTFLIGILLTVIRIIDFDPMHAWPNVIDPHFSTFAATSAIFCVACSLPVLSRSLPARIAWLVGCVLLWGVLPWFDVGLFMLFRLPYLLELDGLLVLFYPAHAVQALIVWGTLFPLRYGFPGSLYKPEITNAEPQKDFATESTEGREEE
ncbi:hypothetical protein [Blastopirellula marina]|uniref:Uncharacterized protein n=1 Tax=Blastopirellula marina TaxID=124 RepID=A0A2S8FWV8_9BACT|nr:hypothetical protein [Blastopirellula marina]PQO36666.1 hypothetical protein C5Y98_11785 [Blastopirellula marina]PTL44496.1 hypothetical protein C5Y97_11795 [Blastopirellula marina]